MKEHKLIIVQVSPEMHKAVKMQVAEDKTTITETVRRLLAGWLEERKREKET